MNLRFENRMEAGRLLATLLKKYVARPRVLVLGLARGGVPVAREVAGQLGVPWDVLVVRKLRVPCQPELAMGAIAPDGVCVLNEDVIDLLDIGGDAIGALRLQEQRELARRERLYRASTHRIDVNGSAVVVVDDGIATGATMRAAVAYLRRHGAAQVVVATPVIAADALRELERIADEVVAMTTPREMRNVGQWYADFSATTDDDVRQMLATAAAPVVEAGRITGPSTIQCGGPRARHPEPAPGESLTPAPCGAGRTEAPAARAAQ